MKITGNWEAADDSPNRIELARTDQDGVFALRDTYEPGTEIPVTSKQLMNLAEAVQKGRFRNVLR